MTGSAVLGLGLMKTSDFMEIRLVTAGLNSETTCNIEVHVPIASEFFNTRG